MPVISIIVAISENNVIGNRYGMPWHLPNDLQYFKEKTIDNVVVMGRKTYESIGQPLPNRINIVLTSEEKLDVKRVASIDELFELIERNKEVYEEKEIFIIGGAEIYELFLPYAQKMYITRIFHQFEGDIFFPVFKAADWSLISKEKGIRDAENDYEYEFQTYERK